MIRPACLGALLPAVAAAASMLTSACSPAVGQPPAAPQPSTAGQPAPKPFTPQASPGQQPGATPPATGAASGAASQPTTQAPGTASSGVANPVTKSGPSSDTHTPAIQTPAQQRYGLPRNPQVRAPVSIDLSQPLTLQRAIAIGLQRQNTIAIAQQQTVSADARLQEARSQYYPQVTPSYQYVSTVTPGRTSVTSSGLVIAAPQSETTSAGILAHQLIFDTGKREATVGLYRRTLFAQEYALADTRQDVILNVTSDYYSVLRDRELVRVEEESVRRAQTTLDVITAQAQAGTAAQSDTLQSQSDLANARVTLLQAQNQVYLDEAALKNAMGVVTSQPLLLADTNVPTPTPQADATTVDSYVQTAYTNRQDIKEQQELINAQGYNVRIAHINNGVQVDATLDEGYATNPASGEERTFAVTFSYPLFDAGNTRAAVRDQKAQLEQARRTLDQLEQTVRLNIEQAYSTRELDRQSVVAARVAVDAGQTNYDVALEKQRNGLINILDVINAEVQLVNAQVQLVQNVYNFYIADTQLQRYVGQNDPGYVPNVPPGRQAKAGIKRP